MLETVVYIGSPSGLSHGRMSAVHQEARLEQEALEQMRRRAKDEEEDERRRLEEEVAKHQV